MVWTATQSHFDGQGPHWVGPVPCWPWESWLCPSPVLVSKTGPYYLGTGELWLCFLPALEELVSHSTEELILMVGSSEKPMDYGVMGELALQGYWPQIHPLAAGQHKGASVGELALPLTWRGRELTEARADQLSYHPGGLHSALCIGPLQYNSTHNLLEPLKEPILQNHNSRIYKRSFDDVTETRGLEQDQKLICSSKTVWTKRCTARHTVAPSVPMSLQWLNMWWRGGKIKE